MLKYILKIDGMMCGMCEAHINEAIRAAFNVKKVSSLRKVEAHESITRIQQCNFNGKVRLRS